MRQKMPSVTVYIRWNSKPGQPYERVNLKKITIVTAPDVYVLHYYDRPSTSPPDAAWEKSLGSQ
jgi:hypothetical protein